MNTVNIKEVEASLRRPGPKAVWISVFDAALKCKHGEGVTITLDEVGFTTPDLAYHAAYTATRRSPKYKGKIGIRRLKDNSGMLIWRK